VDTVASIVTHLLSFEARLRRARGLAPDVAVFLMKEGRGRHSNREKGNDRKGDEWKSQVICHGCAVKGHINAKCWSKLKLASCETSKNNANLDTSTSTAESGSFHFSVIYSDPVLDSTSDCVITVNLASANRSADYWILDTGSTNQVPGNRHPFESFHPTPKWEHHIKTANNSFVNAEGSGNMSFYVDRPNAKPAKIVLRHVLYVPACGTNNHLSNIQLMQKGVNFDFNLNGATARLGSVLVYEAPLINGLSVLKASAASLSKASVAVDDPLRSSLNSEISEAYFNIRPTVDDKDILVCHAPLGHLFLPAIKRLPSAVRGIQLHAKSPLTCTCEACIMGKMFREPFQPVSSEDKAKTRLLELIHSDVIGPMHTQMMCGYGYMIMFTDDHSWYTQVYFMNGKCEAPAKFKEYVAKVVKQNPKSKVCRIRVDGEGEYASHEKFLEYLADESIIREVSALYSQQQNGISERGNRTVLDPARSIVKHSGMLNKLWAEAVSTAVCINKHLPSRALPNPTPFERRTWEKPDISHHRTFGCLAFGWIHGDLRKKLQNQAYKCVFVSDSAEISTQY